MASSVDIKSQSPSPSTPVCASSLPSIGSLTWKIDDFLNVKILVSPPFISRQHQTHQFPFALALKTSNLQQTDYAVFTLVHRGSYAKKFTVRYRLWLIDASGNRIPESYQKAIVTFNSATNPFINELYYTKRDVLINPANGFLDNGALTIYCEVELLRDICADFTHHQKVAASSLGQKLHSTLESGKGSDVVFVVGQDGGTNWKMFSSYKVILIAQSPVFEAMFLHPSTKEAQENRVIITDVQPDVFEQFIRFLHTGKVTDIDNYARALLTIADKYQIDCLKSLCSNYLSPKLSAESVVEILLLADRHNARELKSICMDFIADNAFKVMATENWKQIEANTNLVVELLKVQSNKRFKK